MGCSPDTIQGCARHRAGAQVDRTAARGRVQALFRRNTPAEPAPPPAAPAGPGMRKDRPTPTRKEAEAARRQRVARNLSKKEARLEASRHARAERMRAINARDATPEKALLRDYVDARFI